MAKKYSEYEHHEDEHLFEHATPTQVASHEADLVERKEAYKRYPKRDYPDVGIHKKYGSEDEGHDFESRKHHVSEVRGMIRDARSQRKEDLQVAHKEHRDSIKDVMEHHHEELHGLKSSFYDSEDGYHPSDKHWNKSIGSDLLDLRKATANRIREVEDTHDGMIAKAHRDHAFDMHKLYKEHGKSVVDEAANHEDAKERKAADKKAGKSKPVEGQATATDKAESTSVQTGPHGGRYRVLKSGEKTYLLK